MVFNNNLRLDVSVGTICANYEKIKNFTKREVAVVLKANAYGLGVKPISQGLIEAGCDTIFAATVYEGVYLRKSLGSKPAIFILNCFQEKDLSFFPEYNLQPVINSLEQIDLWLSIFKKTAPLTLHFDTGMHRAGLEEREREVVLQKLKDVPVEWVMSHMACAENPDDPHNAQQLERFHRIIAAFPQARYSLAASESLNLPDDYFFHRLRIGKALYGSIHPFAGKVTESLQFAFKTQARILQTRTLYKGDTVGYGATYVAPETRQTATIGIGFADGLPRSCSNKGAVYIENYQAPILGRVSMDLTVIDVSEIPSSLISANTWVDVIRDRATFYRQAQDSNSGIYELVTRLGGRYDRRYIS